MYEFIEYGIDEGVASVFLSRPEKKNAYQPRMGLEIVAALEGAMADPQARVVILSGRGDAFCGGVDLDFLKAYMAGEVSGDGPTLGEEHFVNGWPLELAEYPKPIIAAINGDAFGVGVTMTLGCDVRYAADGARLGLNFTRLGILPGLGSSHHLPRLVGMGKAMELVLSGATVSAQQAFDIGLVQRVCPVEQVYQQARELALAMAGIRPEVLSAARRALRHGATASLADAIASEKALTAEIAAARAGGN